MKQYSTPDSSGSDTKKRNILFITCDQRLFRPVNANGFTQPALERLVARGVSFENHYISSAVCTPSLRLCVSVVEPSNTA